MNNPKKTIFPAGHWLMMAGCILAMAAIPLFIANAGVVKSGANNGSLSWAWLLMLACPLMHIFMMRGHRHRGHHSPARPMNCRNN